MIKEKGAHMNNLKTIIYLLLLIVMIGCSTAKEKKEVKPTEKEVTTKPPENQKKEIVIVGTADIHGRIYPYKYKESDSDKLGGFAKASTFIKEMRNKYPDLLLIDMGDSYFYEPLVKENSPSIVPVLNYLKYDVMVMGNHELYLKNSFLTREMNKFNGIAIANNVYLEKGEQIIEVLPNYAVLEVDGIRVAFTGSSVPQLGIRKFLLSYEYNIKDPLQETKRAITTLTGKYDLLVGTFHLTKYKANGSSGVFEVMEGVPEFHLAFNGHMHEIDGRWIVDGKHIISNAAYGITARYAKIQLEKIVGRWKVMSVEPHTVYLDDYEADPEFLSKFLELHKETVDYVESGPSGWEKIYKKLNKYIIP